MSLPRVRAARLALAAQIVEWCLTPGDKLPAHSQAPNTCECAASLEQARLCFRFVRNALEPTGEYRFIDSVTRVGITHVPSNTRLSASCRPMPRLPWES